MNGQERSPDSSSGTPPWADIHVLAEFNSLNDIHTPIKATNRIQYTCFDISKRYIAFGANTGGIYIFHRDSLKYLQFIANQDGHILLLDFAPNDNVLAVATSKGIVSVFEHNSEHGKSKSNKLQVSPEHRHNQVTALKWDSNSSQLFIGDDTGKVSVVNVTLSKTRSLFTFPYEVLMKLNSRVVQLDYAEKKLIVSTISKCYLCFTDRQKFVQVGKKPRDGDFGACFYYNAKNQPPVIYSARPGSRIWEADCNGEVLNTHQLRDLFAIAPSPLVTFREDYQLSLDKIKYPARSINFSKLLFVGDHFLAMWTDRDLFIIDPVNVNVVLWNNQIHDKLEVKCYKSVMYFLSHQGVVRKLSLMPLGKCIAQIYTKQMWKLCAQVCWHHQNIIITAKLRRYVPISMIENLKEKLSDEDLLELSDHMDILLNKLETDSGDPPSPISSGRSSVSSYDSYRLESGIFVVHPPPGINNEEEFYGLNSEIHIHSRNFTPSPWNHNTPCHSPQKDEKSSPGLRYTFVRKNSSSSIHSSQSWDLDSENKTSTDSKNWDENTEHEKDTFDLSCDHLLNRKYSEQYLNRVDCSFVDHHKPKRFLSIQNLQLESCTQLTSGTFTGSLDMLDSVDALTEPIVFSDKNDRKNHNKLNSNNSNESQNSLSSDHVYLQTLPSREQKTIPEVENANHSVVQNHQCCCSSILDITADIKHKFENCQIFYDPNQVQYLLTTWISQLHQITFSFLNTKEFLSKDLQQKSLETPSKNGVVSTECSLAFSPKNFITNEELISLHKNLRTHFSTHQDVCEFVTLCFEAGVFNISTFFYLLQNNQFPHLSQVKYVNNYCIAEKFVNNCNVIERSSESLGRKSSSVQLILQFPHGSSSTYLSETSSNQAFYCSEQNNFLNNDHSVSHLCISSDYFSHFQLGQTLDCDLEAAVFIKLYFPLLDAERIKKAISYHDGKRYHRWSALMDCIIDYHYELLPLLNIYREIEEHPDSIVELLLDQMKNVSPLDSFYIIQRLSKSPDTLVNLAYSIASLQADSNKTKSADYIANFFKDPEVLLTITETLLKSESQSDLECECGLPRPGSHLFEWKHDTLLKQILKENITEKESLKNTCEKNRYWSGFLLLSKEEWCEKALKYLVQLGDVVLLSDYLQDFSDITEEKWLSLLRLKCIQEPECDSVSSHILCVNCGSLLLSSFDSLPILSENASLTEGEPAFSLTWENLGNLLISHCGPQQATNLLQTCDIPDTALSENFFRKLFRISLIKEEQRLVAHEMLEVVDAHLWSKRSSYFPPQIESLIMDEKQHLLAQESDNWKIMLQKLRFEFQQNDLKAAGTHWGLNINLNRVCPCCLMPLTSPVDSSGLGLLIFKCGHVFHCCCLPERFCIQCPSPIY